MLHASGWFGSLQVEQHLDINDNLLNLSYNNLLSDIDSERASYTEEISWISFVVHDDVAFVSVVISQKYDVGILPRNTYEDTWKPFNMFGSVPMRKSVLKN